MWNGARGSIIALALASAMSATLTAQVSPGLIDGVMAAYGGRDELARVSAYEMRGTVEARVQGGRATAVRTFARPSRLRVVLHYPQRVEVRVLDGEHGWRGDQNGLVTAAGPLLAAIQLQAARAAVPWILDEHRHELKPVPPLEENGLSYPGVTLDLGDGRSLRAYLDPASHHIVRVQTALRTSSRAIVFETRYAEFRWVDGVLFAFAEENFASGTHTGSTRFEAVIVNPSLQEGTFGPHGRQE